jgi:hypothetical protein
MKVWPERAVESEGMLFERELAGDLTDDVGRCERQRDADYQ